MPTITDLLNHARAQLTGAEADIEAEWLLEEACGVSHSWRYTHPHEQVDEERAARLYDWVQRRVAGEPLAYITGRRAFWDIELNIGPDVLIPRVDTECLVEQALLRIPPDAAWQIADLGTGSGVIALVLARERPQCAIVAADISAAALAVAAGNAAQQSIENVDFQHGHWLQPLAGRLFDMIVSNPPYIEQDDPHLQQGDLVYEPEVALHSGPDGLDAIREIISDSRAHLRHSGWLLLEHGYDQGAPVRELLHAADYHDVFTVQDHGGNDRVSGARR